MYYNAHVMAASSGRIRNPSLSEVPRGWNRRMRESRGSRECAWARRRIPRQRRALPRAFGGRGHLRVHHAGESRVRALSLGSGAV